MAGTITPDINAPFQSKGVALRNLGLRKITVTMTTDASGDATASTVGTTYGRLVAVGYKKGTLDASADITVTDANSGATILSTTDGFAAAATAWFRPTSVITDNAGTAVTAAATAPNVNRDILLTGKVKVGVANGGNAGTGYLYLVIDDQGGGLEIGE